MGYGFESVEQNHGRLTIDKSQQQVIDGIRQNLLEGVTDKAVERGLCLGWSAEWIHHNSAGSDFWQWLKTPGARGDLIRMAHQEHDTGGLQALFQVQSLVNPDREAGKKNLTALSAVREKKKTWATDWIESKDILSAEPRYEPDEDHRGKASLARQLTSGEGFKLVTLQLGPALGAHATAVSVSGQRVVYMDPNGGEAEFETHKDFQTWLCDVHLKCYESLGFNNYTIDSFPTPVNAAVSKDETLHPYLPTRSDRSKRGGKIFDASDVQQALGGGPSASISSPSPSTTGDRSKRGGRILDASEAQRALSGAEGPSSPPVGRTARRRPEGMRLTKAPTFSEKDEKEGTDA